MIAVVLALTLAACRGRAEEPQAPPGDWANAAPATVVDVVPCGDQVVLRVTEAVWEFDVLVPAAAFAKGDLVLLGTGPVVRDHSCGDRVFAEVVRVDAAQAVSDAEMTAAIRIDPPPGGLAIADVYARSATLKGAEIALAGRIWKVAKYGGTNWYHMKDGTGTGDTADFTFTTHDVFAIGDLVEVRGPLTTDKDLGFGYFYAVIIEDAKVGKR